MRYNPEKVAADAEIDHEMDVDKVRVYLHEALLADDGSDKSVTYNE
jgi:hypothetical protein